jgi:hypothetical protein
MALLGSKLYRFFGISMPYARSLPSSTTKYVIRVPGNPKMKATMRHPVLELFCALMPAKQMFARTQRPDAPTFPADRGACVMVSAAVAHAGMLETMSETNRLSTFISFSFS